MAHGVAAADSSSNPFATIRDVRGISSTDFVSTTTIVASSSSTARKTVHPHDKSRNTVKLVTRSAEDWRRFLDLWKGQRKFSWSLFYSSKLPFGEPEQSTVPLDTFLSIPDLHEIEGLVVHWSEWIFVISLDEGSVPSDELWGGIRQVMEAPSPRKILWDMKSQLKLLLAHSVQCHEQLRDPRVLHWLMEPDLHKDHNIEQAWNTLDRLVQSESFNSVKLNCNFQSHSQDPVVKARALRISQATLNAVASMRLYLEMNSLCVESSSSRAGSGYQGYPGLMDVFYEIEMRLLPVISEMEFVGIGYDASIFSDMQLKMEQKVDYIQNRANSILQRKIDLSSPEQVTHAIFEQQKIPYPLPLKLGEKMCSNKLILQMVREYALPGIVLEHRKLTYTINHYLDPLPRFSHVTSVPVRRGTSAGSFRMSRIFATCHQTNVPTGRIAFENPNLQSICHSFDYTPLPDRLMGHNGVEDGIGSPLSNKSLYKTNSSSEDSIDRSPLHQALSKQAPIRVSIRKAFVAAPGYVLLSCDYSHIELRIMAHFSKDSTLLPLLEDPSNDLFVMMACAWFGLTPPQVETQHRAKAKAVCYGIIYGKGSKALAHDLECDVKVAKQFMTDFKKKFKGIAAFISGTYEHVESQGYVETLSKRRRFFPGAFSPDREEKARARRQAINTRCQGTAADIVKRAMNSIWWNLFRNKTDTFPRILVNLHDELLFEIPEEELAQMSTQIKLAMETTTQLPGIPLPVKLRAGPDWGSLVPLEEYFIRPRSLNLNNVD